MMTCSVCGHPDRLAIETALMSGRSSRAIAGQWTISKSSLLRHKDHVQAVLNSGRAAVQSVQRATLEQRLDQAHQRLDEAEASGDPDVIVKAVSARAKLVALEFGTKRDVTRVDPKTEFDALSPEAKRERLAEAKTRVAELEAEVTEGAH